MPRAGSASSLIMWKTTSIVKAQPTHESWEVGYDVTLMHNHSLSVCTRTALQMQIKQSGTIDTNYTYMISLKLTHKEYTTGQLCITRIRTSCIKNTGTENVLYVMSPTLVLHPVCSCMACHALEPVLHTKITTVRGYACMGTQMEPEGFKFLCTLASKHESPAWAESVWGLRVTKVAWL